MQERGRAQLVPDKSWEHNFLGFEQKLNGEAKSPLHQLRKKAFQSFIEAGFPSTKNEAWKYTNLATLSKSSFRDIRDVKPEAAEINALVDAYSIPGLESYQIVFVNGTYVPALSRLPKSAGVVCKTFLELTEDARKIRDARLNKIATQSESVLVALNTAFVSDGVFLSISAETIVDKPIQIFSLGSSESADTMNHARVMILAGRNSQARVIETYASSCEEQYLSTAIAEIWADENSTIHHCRINFEGPKAFHLGSVHIDQKRSSNVTTSSYSFGGALTRSEVYPVLNGEGIETHLYGLTVLDGTQHVDNYTVIDHAKPHCLSNELYKGIYSGKAHGIFSGTIIVRQDAQKTNAIQSNNSILLSNDAVVDTRPQLKIWADDVRCTHGATVGQLDEDSLFYLRARGIPKAEARNMLLRAFSSDVLSHLSDEPLREFLEAKLFQKLDRML